MGNDDEIERLLREVDSSLAGGASASAPAKRGASTPAPRTATGEAGGSPLRTGLVAGVLCGTGVGAVTFVFAWLPFVDNPVSSGLGAFVGAFITGTALSWRRRG